MQENKSAENGTIPISSAKMVRFAANIPLEIALQSVDGVRVDGRYGDRIKYTLTDNRVMYVAPLVADRLRELDIQPGEVFHICKRQVKEGSRKIVRWLVDRMDGSSPQLERDLRESIEQAKQSRSVAESGAREERSASPHEPPPLEFYELGCKRAEGSRNGHKPNGADVPATLLRSGTDNSVPQSPDTQLAHALKTAIAAAAEAEEFAKTLNYPVRFSTEDLRSMGITVLIGMQQRAPR